MFKILFDELVENKISNRHGSWSFCYIFVLWTSCSLSTKHYKNTYFGADKPPIADLQYFLDFQTHKAWAPIYNDLPLGLTTNKATKSPAIHINMMGPKLYVNTSQVLIVLCSKEICLIVLVVPNESNHHVTIIRLWSDKGQSLECASILRASNRIGTFSSL